MQILPVLDVMGGQVVRGIAGRRETYAPIESQLVSSSTPSDIAAAFRREFSAKRLYVADLDAITQDRPQWDIIRDLTAAGWDLLVDSGLREVKRAKELVRIGVSRVVVALETTDGPTGLQDILSAVTVDRVVFSLDLMDGRPLGNVRAWGVNDPLDIARRVINLGVSTMILLDLASVGIGRGVPTCGMCTQLRREYPHVTLIGGGGIRDRNDLVQLERAGFNVALVASALHNGRITRDDVAALHR